MVTEIRAAGHLTAAAMVGELNARGVRACLGGCWTMQTLRRALKEMRKYKIEYEPKEEVLLAARLAAKAKAPKRSNIRGHWLTGFRAWRPWSRKSGRPVIYVRDGGRTQWARGPRVSRRSLDGAETTGRSQSNAKVQDRLRTQRGRCARNAARCCKVQEAQTVKGDALCEINCISLYSIVEI
jgi:hypothetical protein